MYFVRVISRFQDPYKGHERFNEGLPESREFCPPPVELSYLLPARDSCFVVEPSSRAWPDTKRVPFSV